MDHDVKPDSLEVSQFETLVPRYGARMLIALQERLKEHARAFDGLLSIIPAKYYYGEDTSVGLPPKLPFAPLRSCGLNPFL